MKLGIIGAARVVRKVMPTLSQMPEIELYALASHNSEKAASYKNEYGIEKIYDAYEELYADPNVDLVYVCTANSFHYGCIKDALNAGKAVLCEKPITMNAKDAEEVFALAKEKGLFLAEAMWIRYMPAIDIIKKTLGSGIIGKVNMFTASLSYNITYKERIMKPELGGGALLDLGVYGINFALIFMGNKIKKIDVSMVKTETGVDESESITIQYEDGPIAVLAHSITNNGGREGIFHGEKGHIVVDNINCPSSMDIYDEKGRLLEHQVLPKKYDGFEYEFEEAMEFIQKGEIESKSMPASASIEVMKICDQIREQWRNI